MKIQVCFWGVSLPWYQIILDKSRCLSPNLEHLFGLLPLVGVHDAGFAVSVRVADERGDLAHLLLLEDVRLGADPRHNRLESSEGATDFTVCSAHITSPVQLHRSCVSSIYRAGPHLSKVQDEAVSLVEAFPGQLHLLGTNVAFPFDLIQPVHCPRVLGLPEAGLHTALL